MPTSYHINFRGIIHLPGDRYEQFFGALDNFSKFILEMMASLNPDKNPNEHELIELTKSSGSMENIQKIIQFSEEEIQLILIGEDQQESHKLLETAIKSKGVLKIIYDNLNNLEQLKDFCSRSVDLTSDVSNILKNVDKWNTSMSISYIEKLQIIMKKMLEYKKENSGRDILLDEINQAKLSGDKIINAVFNFMTNRAANYGNDEGNVNLCALDIKTGFESLINYITGATDVEKVRNFKNAMDLAVEYLSKEFEFGVVVNVTKTDDSDLCIAQLEGAGTEEERDQAAITLLNNLSERAMLEKNKNKKLLLTKTQAKKGKGKSNYAELLQAAREMSKNIEDLKEVVKTTDPSTTISTVSLSRLRDELLS
ncbi:Uncharacterized protein QTN25_009686 [Entamoeba marina]